MPRLLQRRRRCFYCNQQSPSDHSGTPRTWTCPFCDAVNHLDQFGQITDPPADETAPAPSPQFVRGRSPPMMQPAARSPFCESCQRNQALVHQLMAEYIPDEDHPDYDRHVATADAYRIELEDRYPQVCENCIGQVRDQVRAAGYTAKTDHLRRILEQSKQTKMEYFTPREIWTLRIIGLAKCVYLLNICVALAWHSSSAICTPRGTAGVCATAANIWGHLNASYFHTTSVLPIVKLSLVADLLTIWWNPKLKQKMARHGGRMQGLAFLWFSRLFVLGLRTASYIYLQRIPEDEEDLRLFRLFHSIVLFSVVLSVVLSWKTVRIAYRSAKSFMQPLDPYLPSVAPRSATPTQQTFKTVKPKADVYDTMAQSFTTSFSMDNDQPACPPSPTLSATTMSHDESVLTTPYPASRYRETEEDAMDWTPTRRRFAKEIVEVQPPLFNKSPQKAAPAAAPKEPHSIFAQRDPNPFRNKVPAFPKGSIHAKRDPWKAGIWQTAPEDTKKAFLKEVLQQGGSDAEGRAQLQENGVPRNVKKAAEMFKEPKLKYDYLGYVGEKTTGLEDSFNNMFSK